MLGHLQPIPTEQLTPQALRESNHPRALLCAVQRVQGLHALQDQHPVIDTLGRRIALLRGDRGSLRPLVGGEAEVVPKQSGLLRTPGNGLVQGGRAGLDLVESAHHDHEVATAGIEAPQTRVSPC